MKVKVLYDFESDVNEELNIKTNDILEVTKINDEDGWWQGRNSEGKVGLFPANYCEVIEESIVDIVSENQCTTEECYDSFEDEDDDEISDITSSAGNINPQLNNCESEVVSIKENEKMYIIKSDLENEYTWHRFSDPYTVDVQSPKKQTKFSGIKTYIAYELCPSFCTVKVARRYKHFDWLYKRLKDKFVFICIPSLPDKQISGRYVEHFVEHRRLQLQIFVDWICRHPIISYSDVWMNFLLSYEEKDWKKIKREAERDPLVRFDLCDTIFLPKQLLQATRVEAVIDDSINFAINMDIAIKNIETGCLSLTKTYQIFLKKDFNKISEGFSQMAKAIESDDYRVKRNYTLANPLYKASNIMTEIADLFDEQPKTDLIPFTDTLNLYHGITSSLKFGIEEYSIINSKRKQFEKSTDFKNSDPYKSINARAQKASYSIFAELSHLRDEREKYFCQDIIKLFEKKILFYQKLIEKLETAKSAFM